MTEVSAPKGTVGKNCGLQQDSLALKLSESTPFQLSETTEHSLLVLDQNNIVGHARGMPPKWTHGA